MDLVSYVSNKELLQMIEQFCKMVRILLQEDQILLQVHQKDWKERRQRRGDLSAEQQKSRWAVEESEAELCPRNRGEGTLANTWH